MNREATKSRNLKPAVIFLALALILPISVNALRANIDTLGSRGERLAAIAALVNMPSTGLGLLLEEVRAELGGPDHSPDDSSPVVMIPITQSGAHDAASHPDARPDDLEEGERPPAFGQAVEATRPLVRPRIPPQYQAQLVRENFAGREGGQVFAHGAGLLRNDTSLSNEYIQSVLETPHALTFSQDGPLIS